MFELHDIGKSQLTGAGGLRTLSLHTMCGSSALAAGTSNSPAISLPSASLHERASGKMERGRSQRGQSANVVIHFSAQMTSHAEVKDCLPTDVRWLLAVGVFSPEEAKRALHCGECLC